MRHLLFVLAFSGISLFATAKQWTVNNNTNLPGNPGQFTDIDTAIRAANAGDTILVAGSPNIYTSNLIISKKIMLLGPGYNPDKQNPLTATIQGSITLNSNAASGFVIMGFKINGGISFASGTNINGALIRRNQLNSSVQFADSNSNVTVAENIMTSGYMYFYTSKSQPGLLITNNIFTVASGFSFVLQFPVTSTYLPVTIVHNLFLAGSSASPSPNTDPSFASVSYPVFYNMVIQNNIFYNINAGPAAGTTFSGFAFDNNITYGAAETTLPPTASVGTGNKNNTDPMLTTLFSDPTNATLNYNTDNLRLQAGSPAIKAGTDNTDIGPTGGLYPIYTSTNRYLTGEPPIPEVKTAIFTPTSAVAPGGTLQIQTTATKIN